MSPRDRAAQVVIATVVVSRVLQGFTCALALSACSNELRDLYAPSGDAGLQAAVPELPLPAQPDPPQLAECEACAEQRCGEVRKDCLEDDACSAVLACSGTCDDPACIADCEAELGTSPFYDDYFTCVLVDACAVECNAGESFACADHYAWSPAEESRLDVRFRFSTPPWLDITGDVRFERFLVGSEVHACSASNVDCLEPIDSARIDATSRFELTLTVAISSQTFVGFLEIDELPGAYTVPERLWWHPLSRAGEVRFVTLNYDTVRQASTGVPLDGYAPLVVYLTDCMGMGAHGLRVELPGMPELRPLYATPLLTFDADIEPSSIAVFPDVPAPLRASPFIVRALRDGTDEVLAERTVSVHEGVLTHAFLAPRPR